MKLSPSQQNSVRQFVDTFRFVVQWGSVPFIVYLGFRYGPEPQPNGDMAPLTLLSLFYG